MIIRKKSHRVGLGLLGVISNYIFAQGAGFAIQSITMAMAGPAVSGAYGIALLTINLTVLLGDLGYGMHFLRDVRLGTRDWELDWQAAQGHRLIVLVLMTGVIALVWPLAYGRESLSSAAILFALPSICLSYFNYSPVLFAAGKMALANIGRLAAAIPMLISAAIILSTMRHAAPATLACWLGAAITLGQIAQAVFYILTTRLMKLHLASPVALFSYLRGDRSSERAERQRRLMVASGRLWGILLVGTTHGAIPSFLIAAIWPAFLPYQLLMQTMLAGVTGVQEQTLRALTPMVARRVADSKVASSLSLISNGASSAIALGLAGVCAALAVVGPGKYLMHWGPFIPVLLLSLLEWVANNLTSTALPVVLARHAENFMFRSVLAANGLAAIIVVLLAAGSHAGAAPVLSVSLLYVARSMTAFGVGVYLWHRLKLQLRTVIPVLLLSAVILSAPSIVRVSQAVLAMLLLTAGTAISAMTARRIWPLLR